MTTTAHRRADDRRCRREHRRRAAAMLIGGVLWLGLASQHASAQVPPTTESDTGSGMVAPAPCTVEIAVEAGAAPPVSTVPGTCATSATSGTFSAPGIQLVSADRLPATGRTTEDTVAAAAVVFASGAVLRVAARRPRTR